MPPLYLQFYIFRPSSCLKQSEKIQSSAALHVAQPFIYSPLLVRFMVPEKHFLLDNTNEFSGTAAFCQEKLFSIRKCIPVTEKVLHSETAVVWV